MSRALVCLLAVAGLCGMSGCGGGESSEQALAPVELTVTSPADATLTSATEVTVTGTVTPAGASVLVGGEEADGDGNFSASVTLAPGTNVIDVIASADRRRTAVAAVRVTRQMPVAIPDVSGQDPDSARRRLEGLGFEVTEQVGGGLLDDVFPGDPGVCGSIPEAGERALPGTTVELELRRSCG